MDRHCIQRWCPLVVAAEGYLVGLVPSVQVGQLRSDTPVDQVVAAVVVAAVGAVLVACSDPVGQAPLERSCNLEELVEACRNNTCIA